MDKNTLIGLGLIGAILVTFSLLNRPSEEELLKQRQATQQTEQSVAGETASIAEELPLLPEGWIYQTKDGKASKNAEGLFLISDTIRQVDSVWATPKKAEKEKQSVSESKPVTAFASRYMHEDGQSFTLENDLIKVEVLEKGGRVGNVYL
jgi:hypothetical protein